MTDWFPRFRRGLPRGWVPAPISRTLPEDATQHLNASRLHDEESLAITPSYEDFVLLRRPLPSNVERALEVARNAAAADPEVRRRVLQSEAAKLALHEAVELAVVQRLVEGRPLGR